ncbi:hypothetical protein TNCV_5013891 [Trichonephila clavipes]|nr:hypothetical protein TNCV_5013891 [Trichonephila clavipes]
MVKVMDSRPVYHEFEPSAAEDLPCRAADAPYIHKGSNTYSRCWYGVESWKEGWQLKCRSRHFTMVQSDEVRRQ